MSLSESYSPRWLYLHEFALALALPGTDEDELKDAIALLIRDRLIVDGRLNEAEFRFLEGRPDLRTTAWVNTLTSDDFNWTLSQMIAGVDTTKPKGRLHDHIGLLIEIAASTLRYFGEPAKEPRRKPGPRSKVDWETVFDALKIECTDRGGVPSEDNDNPKWRKLADAERWVAQLLQDRGERVEESWLREKVKEMLARIEQAGI